jgi:hypothetical protein
MIEKIITSGYTGAAGAALAVAVKLGLAHGGWCREGDEIPDRYQLEAVSDESYQSIADKVIGAAHGSLFFCQDGNKTDLGFEISRKTALRLNKPFLEINISRKSGFAASRRIAMWINENRIRVLHVDGEKKDQNVASLARSVTGILEATLFLVMMESGIASPLQSIGQREQTHRPGASPKSLDAALKHLERSLPLKDKATIANMAENELTALHATLGSYINRHFDLFSNESDLLADCRRHTGPGTLAPDEAAALILRFLWERLRATYRIRLIK